MDDTTKRPIEEDWFTWESWDQIETMALAFYGCVLKKDIGQYKSGTKVTLIELLFDNSLLNIWAEDPNAATPSACFRIGLTIVEEIRIP
jgi:hypothetical protein